MHNSYYYIRQLSKALEKELVGLELGDCFSQNKDELVLGFCASDKEFWMKASLQPDLCMLIFPEDFARSKEKFGGFISAIIRVQGAGCQAV